MMKLIRGFGRGLRNGLVAIGALAFVGGAVTYATNFTLTQGSGTTFASVVISGANYVAHLVCDATAGAAQCQTVNGSGQALVLEGNSSSILTAVQAAIPAGTNTIGNVGSATGDPCTTVTHTFTPINYSASGLNTTPLIAGTSAKKTYICHIILNNNAAETVGIIETTTATSCATDVRALWGGATHSSSSAGFNFAATSGVALGNGGFTIAQTSTNNDDVCFIQSAATQMTGGVEWVQQ